MKRTLTRAAVPLAALLAALLALTLLAQQAVAGHPQNAFPANRAAAAAAAAAPVDPSPALPYQVFLPLVVKPQPGTPPAIASFTASPALIALGGTSTLSWSVSGAASLSLAPGIGAATGASYAVSPAATTEYTLTATNAHGSASATVTVTVADAPASGSFFIVPTPAIDRPTSHPTVRTDAAGGVHVAFTPESSPPEDPGRPIYYAYCPGNCASAAAFTRIALGDGVEYANLALDADGRPRLLARLRVDTRFVYQYWTCDSGCTNPAQWTSTLLGYAYARPVASGEPFSQFFALDDQGRPRFVYFDAGADHEDPHWGAFYAFCDTGCANAANWHETRLLDDPFASTFALAFGPAGQARLAYATYNSDDILHLLGYAECPTDCGSAGSWQGTPLAATASASVTANAGFALQTDAHGHPRLALYTGTGIGGSLAPNRLYYLACEAASCAQAANWSALDLGLADEHGTEGVDLALDEQDQPRLAYHAPLAAGFGLYYAWCNVNCANSAAGWQSQKIEPSEQVNQELPIPPWPGCAFPQCNPPVPACTVSFWDTGVRPSLALDGAGHPRIAYDADHHQGGACGAFTDTRLTRFALFSQP
ncbi:MAG: hypothetical protein IT318_17150 [Anaerolineales bacterium]|nr:hypothetical protein [Anaerolineales bacterium]